MRPWESVSAPPVADAAAAPTLVDCLQRLMAAFGGGDAVFGGGFPGERAGLVVVVLDAAVDGRLQADQGGGVVGPVSAGLCEALVRPYAD